MSTTPTYEQFATVSKEQMEKAAAQIVKGYEEYATFSKANVDALIQAGTVLAKGFEELGKRALAYSQSSLESGAAAGKAAMSVKTVRDLVDLQSSYTKSTLDTALAESAKLSELSVKVANEAFQPINARLNATIEKLGKPLAA
ncbi:phasin family protein [Skermanella sp. TT6]|uniref:Phasin family protein n=1 Tax=Skermanella cutis TaxID=2775420 RepID=A0ABX7BBZ9_9PROT|nr:phasin family protein [Skermanella sp. TT6]QQP91110.1 phasin family protein [Skermanella sp. TT6]